jgi:hypothetical protein
VGTDFAYACTFIREVRGFFAMDNGIRFEISAGLASGSQKTTRYNNRAPA